MWRGRPPSTGTLCALASAHNRTPCSLIFHTLLPPRALARRADPVADTGAHSLFNLLLFGSFSTTTGEISGGKKRNEHYSDGGGFE